MSSQQQLDLMKYFLHTIILLGEERCWIKINKCLNNKIYIILYYDETE